MRVEEIFAMRLRSLRRARKLSQQALADELGIGQSTIAQYETGKSVPTAPMIVAIARFFGVSTDYLLGLTDNPQPWNNDLPEHVKRQLERLEELERKYKDLAAKIKKLSEEVDI